MAGVEEKPRLFVAAIDFGTTYSGFAFSARSKEDPSIYTCEWKDADLTSSKTPTSLLLDNDQKFKAFGYEADKQYVTSIIPGGTEHNHYYFRRFKMMLHNEEISLDTKIKEECKKEMNALDVFTIAIKYLKDQMLEKLKSSYLKVGTQEKDILYVLTVPAIWADKSKLFMRKAAEKAGIEKDQLKLALEPEAASIYSQELRTDLQRDSNTFCETIKHGMKYMVIDLGGGTADITVHQRDLVDDTLEEVIPPSGGPWGGTSVDDAYLKFLESLFGSDVIDGLKEEDLEDYFHLFHEFEIKKRSIKSNTDKNIVITMPAGLLELIKDRRGGINPHIKKTKYKDTVSVDGQKLMVNPDTFRALFSDTIEKLVKHLKEIFTNTKLSDLKNVIMVGGFSECELVQIAVRQALSPKGKIIIPEESGIAVLKGAVIFGHQGKKIKRRILQYTYGIQSWPEWDPDVHPENKRVRMGGVDRCKDVFFKFATIKEKVEDGHCSSQVFQVLNPDERTLECAIYTSTVPNPRYITDPTCHRLGKLTVDLPKLRPSETLEVEETLVFGGTELLFRAKDLKTGRIFETRMDF